MKGGAGDDLVAKGLKSAQCSPALEGMGMVVWEGDDPQGAGGAFRDEGFLDSVERIHKSQAQGEGTHAEGGGGAGDVSGGADLYSRGRGRRLVDRFRHWAISGSEDRTLRIWYSTAARAV
jgi:hypothetical protein